MKPLRKSFLEQTNLYLHAQRPPWLTPERYTELLGRSDILVSRGPLGVSTYIGIRPITNIRAYDRMIPLMMVNQNRNGTELFDFLKKTTYGPEHIKLLNTNRDKIIKALDDVLYKKTVPPMSYDVYLKTIAQRPSERIKKANDARRKRRKKA